MRLHVTNATGLNIRQKPNTSSPIVGKLEYRDTIEAADIVGIDVWAKLPDGTYCAIQTGNRRYMEFGDPPIIPTHPDGFDAPVGTDAERAIGVIWPGLWRDANGYCNSYSMGYHTGADLNLNSPTWNLDKGAPVYAISDGVVTFAGLLPGTWGYVVVIKHRPLSDGTPVYSRYAHLKPGSVIVNAGEEVHKGCMIGAIGGMPGQANSEHLHFDISCTDILATEPGHWPGFNEAGRLGVLEHYVDPAKFLRDYRDAVVDLCPGGGETP